ncbi:MAG: calcium/sodium antiporter [Endozoicomonas sp.]
MTEILTFLAAILIGFIVLSWSADRLIEVASTLASRLGMSILIIGMTIVAFGTSAPELLVSAVAAYEGAGGISIGNALGSNIINTGLVLAVCGLVTPLIISRRILTRELPLLCGVTLFALLLMWDGVLGQLDGLLLGAGLVAYCFYLSRHSGGDSEGDSDVILLPISTNRAMFESLLLLILLLGSSRLLVWGASEMARSFGISELVIGLTVIAFGTSLPELAAALASARKGMFDMVMATVLGSNIFNLLGVLAFPGILGDGIELDAMVLQRDGLAMLGLTAILVASAYTGRSSDRKLLTTVGGITKENTGESIIPKYKSAIMLLAFVAYMGWLLVTGL